MLRRLQGLVWSALLVVLLAGVPLFVWMTGALDPPPSWPSPESVWDTVLDGRVSHDAAIGVIGVVVVLVWLRFVVSVGVAVVSIARGRPVPRIRPLGAFTQTCAIAVVSGVVVLAGSGIDVVRAADGSGSSAAATASGGDRESGERSTRNRSDRAQGRRSGIEGTAARSDGPRAGRAGASIAAADAASSDTACPSPVPGGGSELPVGLGPAVLVAGGVLVALDQARRRRLRTTSAAGHDAAGGGVSRDDGVERLEGRLRSIAPVDRLIRLDLAVRAARSVLASSTSDSAARSGTGPSAAGRAVVETVTVSGEGEVHLRLSAETAASGPFVATGERRWRLAAEISTVTLAGVAGSQSTPPGLVHVGVAEGGDLFVDLHAVGALGVDGDGAASVTTAIVTSLAVSPFAQHLSLIGVDIELPSFPGVDTASVTCVDDVDDALEVIALRTSPTVVVADHLEPDDLSRLLGRPDVAVVTTGSVPGVGWTLRRTSGWWVLDPGSVVVRPVRFTGDEAGEIGRLLAPASALVAEVGDSVVGAVPDARGSDVVSVRSAPAPAPDFVEVPWEFVVRVLGPVTIERRNGDQVVFDKSRSTELITWLALHRERQSRLGARTAMWDLDVQDATFANVVSDARRGLARSVPGEDDWLGRTFGDTLPLHPSVVTDVDLLEARVRHARRQSLEDAVETLRSGLIWVRGMPFSDVGFRWPDADGTTSRLIVLVTAAASEMATRCLTVDDLEGVFWATGRGLMALPGHEELVGLRMRGHARRGDLAGVRHEWSSYSRSLRQDGWADDTPSPKLVALRNDLLAVPHDPPDGRAPMVAGVL